jgi:type IV pilus assembly protein PilN
MFPEINLLPQKKKRNYVVILSMVLFFVFLIIEATIMYVQYDEVEFEETLVKQELQTVQQLQAVKQKELDVIRSSTAAVELSNAVDWVENYPVPTVFFIDHLVSLLPERGFLLSFSFSDSGSVAITVQFDSNREVAYFLSYLKDSAYIDSAKLNSLNTAAVDQNEQTVPRYVGHFQLTLNKSALRQAVLEKREPTS